MHIFSELTRRSESGRPIGVGVVGAGFFGGGLIRQLLLTKGFKPLVVASRTIQTAVEKLKEAGAPADLIKISRDGEEAQRFFDDGFHVVTDVVTIPAQLQGIDVVSDVTGDVLAGAEIALEAIRNKKHVVSANPETQAAVGPILKAFADEAGVVYGDVEGDQPGILMKLYDLYKNLGFEPVAAVNCKGVMKRYATLETQSGFAEAAGIKPWIAVASADGTKLNIEMCIVANATGMLPVCPGMACVETTLDDALRAFEERGLLSSGPIVEYTLGIPTGVFLIAYNERPPARSELRYLKMGQGPYYLFYEPYVLCHFLAVLSILEAVIYHEAVITPMGAPVTDVATYAKRTLKWGQRLAGIGGDDCYGMIVDTQTSRSEKRLPIGLAQYARLKRDILQDRPIRLDDVEIEEENLLTSLVRQQDERFQPAMQREDERPSFLMTPSLAEPCAG